MVKDLLHQVVEDFPPIQHAFGYGSGVFHQPDLYEPVPVGPGGVIVHSGGRADGPQLDFIFAVLDPAEWHRENISRHRSHYSFVASLGPGAVTAVADTLGVGIYFNTLVPWANHRIKYGVISLAALERDLRHWDSLYCAGRLHKPVLALREHPAVAAAQAANLLSALRAALLLLPARFSTEELLHTICGLSYSGDLRMGFAEDSRKVHRIVQGSNAGLRALYREPLSTAQAHWGVLERRGAGVDGGGGAWEQDESAGTRAGMISALPLAGAGTNVGASREHALCMHRHHVVATFSLTLLQHMARSAGLPHLGELLPRPDGASELAAALLKPGQRHSVGWHVRHAVCHVVRASSHRQLMAGFLSAGVSKSVRYALSKLRKAWR